MFNLQEHRISTITIYYQNKNLGHHGKFGSPQRGLNLG